MYYTLSDTLVSYAYNFTEEKNASFNLNFWKDAYLWLILIFFRLERNDWIQIDNTFLFETVLVFFWLDFLKKKKGKTMEDKLHRNCFALDSSR
jgi:hypothetical protein